MTESPTLCACDAATRRDLGPEAVAELLQALRLLNERGSASAAYWQCTLCDEGFGSSHEYSEHVNASHEEVVYLDEQSGAYVTCATCKKEARPRAEPQAEYISLNLYYI